MKSEEKEEEGEEGEEDEGGKGKEKDEEERTMEEKRRNKSKKKTLFDPRSSRVRAVCRCVCPGSFSLFPLLSLSLTRVHTCNGRALLQPQHARVYNAP